MGDYGESILIGSKNQGDVDPHVARVGARKVPSPASLGEAIFDVATLEGAVSDRRRDHPSRRSDDEAQDRRARSGVGAAKARFVTEEELSLVASDHPLHVFYVVIAPDVELADSEN